jgi:Holliday junction resolvase RusA-like endonuclease
MTDRVHFWVPGIPAPAGSKKGFAIKKGGYYTGRVAIVDSSGKRGKEWRQNVADSAFSAMKAADMPPMDGPLFMGVTFHMPRPKFHLNSKGEIKPSAPQFHTIRPDCTKLTRAAEDAMTGIVYRDDAQIVVQNISKILSKEGGCWITVRNYAPPDNT